MIESIDVTDESWQETAITAASGWHEALRERDEARAMARDCFETLCMIVRWDAGGKIHHEFLNELEDLLGRSVDMDWLGGRRRDAP